jgi:phosphoribosyl-ATP pyrophosphohydrolase/phosphoribosyl-AMP cyclohydrolase
LANKGKGLKLDDKGLVAAIVQDVNTNQVLMLGYMNKESAELTLKTGTVWFYSRSRQELWNKGATSGNILTVKELWLDCDNDAILVKAEPAGPTCHTGEVSCFFEPLTAEEVAATEA